MSPNRKAAELSGAPPARHDNNGRLRREAFVCCCAASRAGNLWSLDNETRANTDR